MAQKPLTREMVQQAVDQYIRYEGNKARAAASLGLAPSTYRHRLNGALPFNIPLPPFEKALPKPITLEDHFAKEKRAAEKRGEQKLTKILGEKVEQLTKELSDALDIKAGAFTYNVVPEHHEESEAAAIWLASDWHVEESVTKEQTNGLNEYNPSIARKRGDAFFVNGLRLTDMANRDVKVSTIVLGLLGDFITGHLHQQAVETNHMAPVEATIFAQSIIASGIRYILANSDYKLVVVCKSGNHGRTTKFSEFGSENGHSHEYFMYCSLREMFIDNPRVQFIITEGAHTYIDIFDFRVRLLHGHDMRYAGGVGGITIPVNKALAQWDKVKRADLTCFGHFHQRLDGGNFLCNGSLIGYNAFALSIKASAERPQQQFALIDKERGKTIVAPILVD